MYEQMKELHINFWNYMPLPIQSKKDVLDWKEMGMTTVMTGEGVYQDEKDAKHVAEVLEECQRQNMPAIIFDSNFRITKLAEVGEAEFRKTVREAVAFYERFPAAQYAFVWDEPGTEEQWEQMYLACKILRETSKQIKPFCSLNHYCGQARKKVVKKLEDYYAACKPDFLLYNCYSQCFDEPENQEQGLENFFYNLNIFSRFAQEKNLPLATSLISCGHWAFRCPNADDLRWQLFVSAAHGVTGMYWFHPLKVTRYGTGGFNYRQFATVDGERTQFFETLKEENVFFYKTMEAVGLTKGATLEKVYHVFRSYGGFPYFEKGEDEYVFAVKNPYNRPLVLSRFKRADGKRVIMLVNNGQRGFASVELQFQEGLERYNTHAYLAPGGAAFVVIDENKK